MRISLRVFVGESRFPMQILEAAGNSVDSRPSGKMISARERERERERLDT